MKKTGFIKSFISLLLVIAVILSCTVTGTILTFADESAGISMSKSGIIGGNIASTRYRGNSFNIINDGEANNTTVGLWNYDISDINNITSASLTASVSEYYEQNIDGLSIDFYYINPESASDYLKGLNESNKLTNISALTTNTGNAFVTYIKNNFSLSEKNLIGSLSHNYSSDSTTDMTLDLTTAFHDMKKNSWGGICILAMCNKNNGASASNPIWSDSWVSLSDITYTVATNALDMTKSAVVTTGNGNQRYNGNSFNIVNDGANTCTTLGLWSYAVQDLKYVDSASLNVYVNDYHTAVINDLSIDFYFVDPSKAATYLKDLSTSDKSSTDIELNSNIGDNSITWMKNKFGLNSANKIGSFNHSYTSSVNRYTRLDLTTALNTAKQEKWSEVCVLAMCNKNNNGTSTHIWSDSWIEVDNISYNESSSYIPIEKSGILCGATSNARYNGNIFNIVNDSQANNTTVGLWSYDISDINSGDNASIAATSTKWSEEKIDNFGIEFYWIDSSKVSSYLKPLSTSVKVTIDSDIASNAGSGCASYIKNKFSLNDDNKIGFIEHNYTDNQNKYTTLNLTSAVESAKKTGINNIAVVALCNRNNDGATSYKWSDVWLEMGGINYGADLTLAEVQPLKNAMAEYERKMSSGKIYTNMSSAYTAYVNAQKAIDAYCYGNVKSISISQYATALTSATAAMTEWTVPTANVSPRFSSTDTGTIPLNTGCLWYEYKDDPIVKSYSAEGNNTTANFYYQNGVYLYGESSPNIPYTVGFYRTSSSSTANPANPRVFYVALKEQQGGLTIRNAQYQGDAVSREFTNIINKSYQINSTETGDDKNILLSTGDMRYMANYFNINYTSAFSNNSSYYVEAKPTKFSLGLGYKDAGNAVQWVKEVDGVNTKTFYVINYKSLLDKINSSRNKNALKSVASYKQGGLSSLMQAYDAATSVNPVSYNYSENTASVVANCAAAIKNAVDKFGSAVSFTADKTSYNDLRNALTLSKEIGNTNPIISGNTAQATRYTADSWNAYYSALIQGQNAMADVMSSNGYRGSYNSTTVTSLAGDLQSAMSNLKYNYIVEYISAGGQTMGTLVVKEDETADASSIVNTATIKGVQERQAHIVYSWSDITADRSNYGDSEVITVNEKSTEEACELSPGDLVKEPTCSEAGLRQYTCDICGGVYQIQTEKLEHSYKSEVISSTCAERGYTLYTCINCGDSYKDNYADLAEHTYETVTVEPTCTERGYTAQRCKVCSHEVIDESSYTDALGHKYEYSVIREPDCTFKGVGEYVCVRGDSSYTEEIAEDDNNHGEMIYSRTVQPTASEQGYDIYYCNNLCGYWEKRNFTEPTNTDAQFTDCLEAYNASLLTIVDNFDAYTDESKESYLEAVNSAKADGEAAIEAKDKTALDKATASIIEATALLRIRTVSIKLLVCDVNGNIIEPQGTAKEASYGELVTLDISDEIESANVEKWTIKKNGVTKKINQSSAVCELIAKDDAVISAYLTDENPTAQNKIKLTLQNNDGRIIETKYITADDRLDINSSEIAGVSAPTLTFYSFKQWKTVSANENEIVLRATYDVI